MRFTRPGARATRDHSALTPSPQMERCSEALDRLDVEGRAQGEVDLARSGGHVLADPVDDFLVASRQHARTDVVGECTELGAQAVLAVGEADVDGAGDRTRVAPC